tara:strand:+ start:344 stop:733 length:390 start_codon:yes stop_codon:yes gene_type:complete
VDELMKAIYDEFTNDATLVAALTGGLYQTRADPKTSFPYGVFDLVSNTPGWTFAKAVESARIQFSVFAATNAEIMDIGKKLMSTYDFASLTFTGSGYTTVGLVRENNLVSWDDGYYQYVIDYRMMIHAT